MYIEISKKEEQILLHTVSKLDEVFSRNNRGRRTEVWMQQANEKFARKSLSTSAQRNKS